MCYCSRLGRSNSIFELPQNQKLSLAKRLPQLNERLLEMVAKNILAAFLDQQADFIFTNGRIYTMDEKDHQVEVVAIKGSEILAVGKLADAIVYRGEKTCMVDLHGRTMLPGFIDPHVHMCFTMFRHWTDLGPFINKDFKEVKERLVKAIEAVKDKPNEWVACQLYDPTVMQGEFDVSIKALDSLCSTNPLFILESNGHVAHVNSLAFVMAGLTKDTKDPPHGRFVRDEKGQLTGELQESAVMLMNKYLFRSANGYIKNFQDFLIDCSSKGCTTLNDCGIGIIDPKADMAVLLQGIENNSPVRYSGFLVSTGWKIWMEQKMVPEYKHQYLRVHGMKCWADGSTIGGTASLREDYLRKQWGKGAANYTLEQLVEAIRIAHNNDWQIAVHANGDAGIDLALDAFEIVQKENPKPHLRHRIEHCAICHKDQLLRMKKLNISPSFLIGHVYYWGYIFRQNLFGPERANMVSVMKSAMQMGLKPTMHSDYNVTPVDPIRCIYNAVTRKMRFNGEVLNCKECLSPYEALKVMTINAAWQCHMDDIVGSIEKGKKADFVILDRNPMTIHENDILNIKVMETWMDGQRRYKAEEPNKQKGTH